MDRLTVQATLQSTDATRLLTWLPKGYPLIASSGISINIMQRAYVTMCNKLNTIVNLYDVM